VVRYLFIAVIFTFFVSFAWAETQDEKIKKLQERIEQLEKQLAAATTSSSSAEIQEIRRQLEILAAEVEKLRSGEAEQAELDESKRKSLGLGTSASTVYAKRQGPSIAGYGEMLYENFEDETDAGVASEEDDRIDLLRAVVYLGYRFNERFLFNSEIEFEHANSHEGEVAVEFAYLDYLVNDSLSARAGLVLLPMGLVNEFHEPTSFIGTHRPLTETLIIPSTWRENGAGIVGSAGILNYRAYGVAGMNAAGFSSEGLRDGRQEGALSRLGDFAFVGRLDAHPIPGVIVGGSFFGGNSSLFEGEAEEEERQALEEANFKVSTRIAEIHSEFKRHALHVRALYAHASLDDVAELNEFLELSVDESVGESMNGGYIEAGYDILAARGSQSLTPYIRYEKINTQSDVPAGFLKNPALDQQVWTIGLEYKPIPNIVIKGDYLAFDNEANSGVDQFSIALGYNF
jgi:cell division protein FtsB